jgi:hypothetical protein
VEAHEHEVEEKGVFQEDYSVTLLTDLTTNEPLLGQQLPILYVDKPNSVTYKQYLISTVQVLYSSKI